MVSSIRASAIIFKSILYKGKCIVDLMMRENEPDPKPGKRILCHHPFEVYLYFCWTAEHSELEPYSNF
jgi:hypothetical protein